jgi:hypothetical protein
MHADVVALSGVFASCWMASRIIASVGSPGATLILVYHFAMKFDRLRRFHVDQYYQPAVLIAPLYQDAMLPTIGMLCYLIVTSRIILNAWYRYGFSGFWSLWLLSGVMMIILHYHQRRLATSDDTSNGSSLRDHPTRSKMVRGRLSSSNNLT